MRDECLSQHWFASLSHMRSVIDNWRDDYNHHRPHSTLGTCRRPCTPRSAASSLAALRNPPHPLRCKPSISISKCYECRGQRRGIERLFAWLQNFRRLVVRYEHKAQNFLGFAHLGCMLILLRQF